MSFGKVSLNPTGESIWTQALARSFGHLSEWQLFLRWTYMEMAQIPSLPRWLSRLLEFPGVRDALTHLLKYTVYPVFCGGENLTVAHTRLRHYVSAGIRLMVDYSAEHTLSLSRQKKVLGTWRSFLREARRLQIPFVAVKLTGWIPSPLLEEASEQVEQGGKLELSRSPWSHLLPEIEALLEENLRSGLRILIDAEETWVQPAIDYLTLRWMRRWNHNQHDAIYITFQLYRRNMREKIQEFLQLCWREKILPAIKLVRGAYVEKEREKARREGREDPLLPSWHAVNEQYNTVLLDLLRAPHPVAICIATHNLTSTFLAIEYLQRHPDLLQRRQIWFAHLLGMADPLTFWLALQQFPVAKFVPVAPVEEALPYLLRRLEENQGIQAQFAREKLWIWLEWKRRQTMPFFRVQTHANASPFR